jgi:hypothetical protein
MLLVIAFLEKVNYGGNFSPQGVILIFLVIYYTCQMRNWVKVRDFLPVGE